MEETPTSRSRWFGFERVRVDYKNHAVDITVGSETAWDRSHLRRLRQSSDLAGHVPVIDADVSTEGRPYVVTAAVEEPTLADRLASEEVPTWEDSAGIAEAVANATHEAHERGLFHGSLSPDDIYIIDDEIAVNGLGLTRGGEIPTDRHQWVAPEVLAGDTPTARSDVYSLGKLLEVSLGDSIDLAPRSVKRLIMWSSSDSPDARPRSASEFAEILNDGLSENKNSFRPAFIPTIRANNLTADAEKAIADTQPRPPLASVAAKETLIDTTTTDSSEDFKVAVDKDPTEQLKTIDLNDVQSEDSTEDPANNSLNANHDTKESDSLGSAPKAAAAAAGLSGVAALAARRPGDKKGTRQNNVDSDKATASKPGGKPTAGTAMPTAKSKTKTAKKTATTNVSSKTKNTTTAATTAKPAATADKPKPLSSQNSATKNDRGGLSRFLVPVLIIAAIPLLIWAFSRSGAGSQTSSADGPIDEASETDSVPTGNTDEDTDTDTEADTDTNADTDTDTDTDAEALEPSGDADTSESTDEVAAPEATEPTENDADSTNDVPVSEQATDSSDAAVQVVHGIPATPVDVYVDGELTTAAFQPESIAGPVDLTPGDHDVTIFAAADDPAQMADERTDDAVIDESISASGDPTALIAHLDDTGNPTLGAFMESLEAVDAGDTRVTIRNLTVGAGAATASVDGAELTASLSNGDELQVVLTAGEHSVGLLDEDGEEVFSSDLDLVEGELTTVSFIGSPEESSESVVVQRYSGLSSAPTAVPTGDSGLLDAAPSSGAAQTVLGLMAMLFVSGAMIAFKRRRRIA